MIAFLRGTVAEKKTNLLLLDVGGVGYEVHMSASSLERLPGEGGEARVMIVESFGMYGGGASLYGFASSEEKELFETFRENIPGTGAKKALEFLDKAAKSLPDFRRAILDKDAKVLASVFNFSKKTADKLILALKDKLGPVPAGSGGKRHSEEMLSPQLAQVSTALAALGYRSQEIKGALEGLRNEPAAQNLARVEDLIRLALKKL